MRRVVDSDDARLPPRAECELADAGRFELEIESLLDVIAQPPVEDLAARIAVADDDHGLSSGRERVHAGVDAPRHLPPALGARVGYPIENRFRRRSLEAFCGIEREACRDSVVEFA